MSGGSHQVAVDQIKRVADDTLPQFASYLRSVAKGFEPILHDHRPWNETPGTLGFTETEQLWKSRGEEFIDHLVESAKRLERYSEALKLCARNYDETMAKNQGRIGKIFSDLGDFDTTG
jgi:hypothetical protein